MSLRWLKTAPTIWVAYTADAELVVHRLPATRVRPVLCRWRSLRLRDGVTAERVETTLDEARAAAEQYAGAEWAPWPSPAVARRLQSALPPPWWQHQSEARPDELEAVPTTSRAGVTTWELRHRSWAIGRYPDDAGGHMAMQRAILRAANARLGSLAARVEEIDERATWGGKPGGA